MDAEPLVEQMTDKRRGAKWGIAAKYILPAAIWEQMQKCIPPPPPKKKSGRPRMDDEQAMTAILYVLRTGIPWNALPRSLGASSTVHDRFIAWTSAGVFAQLWCRSLLCYDELVGIDWLWQSMDGAMNKAPLGKKTLPLVAPILPTVVDKAASIVCW
jgi:transposase